MKLKRTKTKKKPGTKSDITRQTLIVIERLALLGCADVEIARVLGVTLICFESWKRRFGMVVDALERGRVHATAEVVAALHKKAVGYSHPDTHICVVKGEVMEIPTTKHYPPDTSACIFILKNKTRNNEEPWTDAIQQHLTISKQLELIEDTDVQKIIENEMSIDELKALQKLGMLGNFQTNSTTVVSPYPSTPKQDIN